MSQYFLFLTFQIPYEAKDLREAFRKAMKLVKEEGAKWSSEREKAIRNDEYTPNDILHHTLQLQGNSKFYLYAR